MEPKNQDEKLCYQYIMNFRAYRVPLIISRITASVILSIGGACVTIVSVPLGIVLALLFLFLGALAILTKFHHDETYLIFNNRVVVKHSNKRYIAYIDKIKSVQKKQAFYEKRFGTYTITVTALNENNRVKKLKLRHVFDANAGYDFLVNAVAARHDSGAGVAQTAQDKNSEPNSAEKTEA